MAKTVGDLLIKLGIDGIEGVNVAKAPLRLLAKQPVLLIKTYAR